MSIISTLTHAPAILLRVGFNAVSVAAVISTIAATIAVGVIVTKIVNTGQGCCDPFHDRTVVLLSPSSLVFDRQIEPYENDYYYNATKTVSTLVDGINEHLHKTFGDVFIKFVASEFSKKPVVNHNQKRKIRYKNSDQQSNKHIIIIKPTNKRFQRSSQESSKHKSLSHILQPPTTSTNIIHIKSSSENVQHTDKLSMKSTFSYELSFSIIKKLLFLFSFSTSTISSRFQLTTIPHLISRNKRETNNCTSISNGTRQLSHTYVNGTLYFNATTPETIPKTNIINALKSFTPTIVLINKCGQESPGESVFSAELSQIETLSAVEVNITVLNQENTIPASLLNELISVDFTTMPSEVVATTPLKLPISSIESTSMTSTTQSTSMTSTTQSTSMTSTTQSTSMISTIQSTSTGSTTTTETASMISSIHIAHFIQ